MKTVILWFRNDLRLHDNEALMDAIQSGGRVVPVYVFDERHFFNETSYGFRKTEVHRARFIIESVHDLRESLRACGSNLIVRLGRPEIIISELASNLKSSWVFCNRERTDEEVQVQDALEKSLWAVGQELRYSRGKMLYYTADLPFPVTQTPDSFTQFRKEVEKITPVRLPLDAPEVIFCGITPDIELGEIPTLEELRYDCVDSIAEPIICGGESAGMARVEYYIHQSGLISSYKETRNGLLGLDYSSKFSAYLAHGCISPKYIYYEILRFEERHGANESTYHLFFELLWRDFFRLMGKKYGNAIFKFKGIKNQYPDTKSKKDWTEFKKWAEGRTGQSFVDAAMTELVSSGYMSNRARQNVASYLIHDMGLNWRMGAAFFESYLIDYDPCSNWGNWNYLAGVGNDPRENRRFNVTKQAERYDPDGAYANYWISRRNMPSVEMR